MVTLALPQERSPLGEVLRPAHIGHSSRGTRAAEDGPDQKHHFSRSRRTLDNSSRVNRMLFESILEEVDGFGTFQILMLVLLCTPRIVLPCHFLLNNFIAAIPPHHCHVQAGAFDGLVSNLSERHRLLVSVPLTEDGKPRACEMFTEPHFELLSNGSSDSDLPTVQCSRWVYSNSTFSSTLATEFDLVCDRKSLARTTSTIFFMGVMLGAVAFGFLSDNVVFGLSSAFATSYELFAVLRFFTGFGLTGCGIISIVLNLYLSPSPVYLKVVPESARWLLANGKVEKARFYLTDAPTTTRDKNCRRNFSDLKETKNSEKTYNFLDLVKTPKFAATLSSLESLVGFTDVLWHQPQHQGFGLNIYLTHFIYSAIEVPAKWLVYVLINVIGRRKSQAGTQLLTGICIFINIFMPDNMWYVRAAVAILGKGASEAAFTTVFLYTTELIPPSSDRTPWATPTSSSSVSEPSCQDCWCCFCPRPSTSGCLRLSRMWKIPGGKKQLSLTSPQMFVKSPNFQFSQTLVSSSDH
ncbi:hypothetical protein WMY93_017899 [Mugilogobius chulae]|uniref:Major facilitator superfamily (MFS) profile domain-containing protein n=1 Tax=Mugilogobius chulae TaxID=88201 RepID=A0AAW0NHA4_9GOBI